jgi:hypothetical protein
VGDLLKVERELARVQGEIDSMTSQLEVMRRRVDMSTLDVSYASQAVAVSRTAVSPLMESLTGFVGELAESAGAVVTFIAGALPWLVIGLPVLWLLVRWLRRFRRVPKPPVASA